ncbi:MAG: 4-alpha-glucanotransferase [Rikenellaceae bacterium]
MEVIFEIRYQTESQQQLWIDGDIVAPMSSSDGEVWRTNIELVSGVYTYKYVVRSGHDIVREEEGTPHTIELEDGVALLSKVDIWTLKPTSRPLNSALFTKSVFRRRNPKNVEVAPNTTILECYCATVEPHQSLAVVGVTKEFGHWNPSDALVMADGEYPMWRVKIDNIKSHTEYKFVLLDTESCDVVSWEQGENRMLVPNDHINNCAEVTRTIISTQTPSFDTRPWRGTGVAIPIFSLRSKSSVGVGDFEDLKKMVDWAADRGMSVIQILPINDTTMGGTWEDSYPYNANSTIALHPQYLALRSVGKIDDESFEKEAAELNALEKIDYTSVSRFKMKHLREIYKNSMKSVRLKRSYREFFAANSWWLEPYALFSHLRDIYETPDFSKWGDDAIYDPKLIVKYKKSAKTEIEFYYFVQYHLHLQLLDASQYARSRGIALKGDIPIGISRTSVDAWIYPELFNMGRQAGAPPDPFSDLGQNWGFPTYNWERMAEDNYRWWRSRFEKMAEYFDAYRIDHILGFFRIWEIPMESIHGLTGQFNPAIAYSLAEIEASGFPFNIGHTRPYITEEILNNTFENIDKVEFFEPIDEVNYRFKSDYDTQRKVADRVKNSELREKLMLLHNEVLFVEDSKKVGYYHPRIMGSWSNVYKALPRWEREAFDRLHDDFYYHRHNDFWRDSAMQKLPILISSTDMLVCGEDLGMIPNCVPDVMKKEQILSLEIERMPKGLGLIFDNPAHYPYLSVCTCSTHDMSTIRGWWREGRDEVSDPIQRYYNEALGMDGVAPIECSAQVAEAIIDRHLNSPAMLTILPWQDWMAVDEELRNADVDGERINVPANFRHYWRYRMHLELE